MFFEAKHDFLKNWRDDVGGHFLDSAAAFAIDNIQDDTVGIMELYRRGNSADVRLKFAYDLVAVAMIKQRNAGAQSVEEFLADAFTFLVEAVKHSVKAVATVTMREIWGNFR